MNFEAKIKEKLGILSNLVAKAKADGRGLTEEEQELYNETESELTSLENALKNEQKIIARKEALKKPAKDHATPSLLSAHNVLLPYIVSFYTTCSLLPALLVDPVILLELQIFLTEMVVWYNE